MGEGEGKRRTNRCPGVSMVRDGLASRCSRAVRSSASNSSWKSVTSLCQGWGSVGRGSHQLAAKHPSPHGTWRGVQMGCKKTTTRKRHHKQAVGKLSNLLVLPSAMERLDGNGFWFVFFLSFLIGPRSSHPWGSHKRGGPSRLLVPTQHATFQLRKKTSLTSLQREQEHESLSK